MPDVQRTPAAPRRLLGRRPPTGQGAANRTDARHLIWLRDQLGDQMICGLVLHAGRHTFRIEERIQAAPIAALWS